MNTQQAYNLWAEQYDTNANKTRDLEAVALRQTLAQIHFSHCLEIGCGTGKNTAWLLQKAGHVTAVDLSEEMLAKAKLKIQTDSVKFVHADIEQEWSFASQPYDLVTFSLVLEHISNLLPVLKKAAASLHRGGYVYIGELHPYKQYSGSKARFETEKGTQVVPCFIHHFSHFCEAAMVSGLHIEQVHEFFDEEDTASLPRILVLLLRKT